MLWEGSWSLKSCWKGPWPTDRCCVYTYCRTLDTGCLCFLEGSCQSQERRLSIRLGASLGRQNCAKGFANWIKLVQFFWDLRFAFFQINILLRSEICLCPNRYTGNHRRLEQISLWGSTKYGFVLNDFQLIVTLVSLRNLCQKRIQSNFSSCDLDHHKKSMICIFCVQSNYDWCLGGIYSIKRLPPNFPSDLDLRRNQTNLLKN
jgi:hypothetical protein